MLRSILIAFDGSPSSLAASRYALELARASDARVKGLAVVNSAWIQRPEAVPLGAMEFKSALEGQELADANARVDAAVLAFSALCKQAGVSASVHKSSGDPFALIQEAAASHDLIAVGRRSIFDVRGEMCELPMCVDRIIRDEPRPVLLVPEKPPSITVSPRPPILVAYDGSPASSRSVHMFALLGLATGRVVHTVTLDEESRSDAGSAASRACALLSLHGATETHAIGLGDADADRPSEAILSTAAALRPDIIVMGAYGRRGIREMFGSCTREVLDACETPVFLYH